MKGRPPIEETFVEKMRRKVRSEEGKDHYRHRKFVVEPVFGQIKQGRGLRPFLLRGYGKVQAEWKLWSLTHNLLEGRSQRVGPWQRPLRGHRILPPRPPRGGPSSLTDPQPRRLEPGCTFCAGPAARGLS
ncbi:MAG: transposase [Thermoplasmata archaeon]